MLSAANARPGVRARRPNRPSLGAPLRGRYILIAPFLAYWLGTFVYYHVGLLVNPPISFTTYAFMAVCIMLFLLTFTVALGGPVSKVVPPLTPGAARWGRRFVYVSALGNILLLVDKIRSGITLNIFLQQTEFLRDDFLTTPLTTYSVPLAGLLYPALLYIFVAAKSEVKIPRLVLVAGAVGFAALLATTALSGNRGSFLHSIFWLLFFLYFVRPTLSGLPIEKRRVRFAKTTFAAICALAVVHIIFISAFRVSEAFLEMNASREELRYTFISKVASPRVEHGIVLLSSYASQQYDFINTILPSANIVGVDFDPFFLWYERQLSRVGLANHMDELSDYALRVSSMGLSEFGWPSLFGHLLLKLGVAGAIGFFISAGLALGWLASQYERTGMMWPLIGVFILYNFINHSYMSIVSDHNISIALIVMFLFRIKSF